MDSSIIPDWYYEIQTKIRVAELEIATLKGKIEVLKDAYKKLTNIRIEDEDVSEKLEKINPNIDNVVK